MHELAERAELVRLHSRAQGIPAAETAAILQGIDTIDDGLTGWATTWATAAHDRLADGDRAGAMARLNLARFPFAHTDDGRQAHADCVALAGEVASARGIERLEFADSVAWYRGAPDGAAAGLLLVCGGIVSIKEQWFSLVALGERLGLSVLLTELPGVGEHRAPYAADAPERLSALLDEVAEHRPFRSVFAFALSFGGTVALKAAARDRRIGGVFSVGPPIRHFFRDQSWWQQVPQTTKDALTVTTGVPEPDLPDLLAGLALEDHELAGIEVPVTAVASLRDEVLPLDDLRLLRTATPSARVVAFDDVHGSPNHLFGVRLHAMAALADFATPRRRLLGAAARLASRLRGSEKTLGRSHPT